MKRSSCVVLSRLLCKKIASTNIGASPRPCPHSRVSGKRERNSKKLTCYIYEQASPLIPVGRGPHVPQQRQPPDSSQAKGAEDRASVRQRRTWSDLDRAVPTMLIVPSNGRPPTMCWRGVLSRGEKFTPSAVTTHRGSIGCWVGGVPAYIKATQPPTSTT